MSRDSLRPTSRTHHKMDIGHHLIVEHDGVPAETGHPGQLQTGQRRQRSGVNLRTDRSRMVGKRPCQERPLLLLLLARFCCWYRWMDALLDEDELRAVVGKSSAAILVQSQSQPGHGRSGTGRRGWSAHANSAELKKTRVWAEEGHADEHHQVQKLTGRER